MGTSLLRLIRNPRRTSQVLLLTAPGPANPDGAAYPPQDSEKGCRARCPVPKKRWQHLAEQPSNEMDSDKLMNLVTQLNHLLGEQEQRSRARRHQGNEGMSFPAAA